MDPRPTDEEILRLVYEDMLKRRNKKTPGHSISGRKMGRPKGPELKRVGSNVQLLSRSGDVVELPVMTRIVSVDPREHVDRMVSVCEQLDSVDVPITVCNIKRMGVGSGTVSRYRNNLPLKYKDELKRHAKKRKIETESEGGVSQVHVTSEMDGRKETKTRTEDISSSFAPSVQRLCTSTARELEPPHDSADLDDMLSPWHHRWDGHWDYYNHPVPIWWGVSDGEKRRRADLERRSDSHGLHLLLAASDASLHDCRQDPLIQEEPDHPL